MKKPNLKILSIRFIFIALGVAVGLLFMAQLRTIPDRITNPATPVMSLRETRDILLAEQNTLNDEASRLQEESKSIQEQVKSKASFQPGLDVLERQKALAGSSNIYGPGLEIVMDDSSQVTASEEAIVHAADLRDVINLLWSSGAEAISINDQRVVFSTAIDCIVNTIMVNNVKISTPFTIRAVGDANHMKDSISSPLNLADIKNRSKRESLIFRWAAKSSLQIPAYQGSFIFSTGTNAN